MRGDRTYLEDFLGLIEDQFTYGGKKYASTSAGKESTDILFETFGQNWLFGTIAKYCHRFRNLSRERDMLKIACYSYILWLKRGFFLTAYGNSPDVQCTTVEIKAKNFRVFVERLIEHVESGYEEGDFENLDSTKSDEDLHSLLMLLDEYACTPWNNLTEKSIFRMFLLSFRIWFANFRETAGSDTDTGK